MKDCKTIFTGLIIFFSSWVYSTHCDAQTVDNSKASVEGLVMDTAGNYSLPSATVAIYKVSDSSLLKYSLSDNSGKFMITGLPFSIPLMIKIDYIGYKTKKQIINVQPSTSNFNIKTINMVRSEQMLKEVEISEIPPMRLNGDTLEFNADAFKLDSNAVVEDLMKKIPGIIMWSDGLITVNGKTVSKVLVEGKPFFGGDARVATQNLPKQSVDKIQVYENKSLEGDINTTTEVNIVLKKGKKNGLFGKVGSGYGTSKRFDQTAMLNFFNPKTQVSITGVLNNVNKNANNIYSLMQYSSYKGEGITTNYSSDFSKRGLNKFGATGYTLEHLFDKNKKLKSDYFLTNTKTNYIENLETSIAINEDVLKRNTNNNSIYQYQNQTSNATYSVTKENYEGHISAEYIYSKNMEANSLSEQTFNQTNSPVSFNTSVVDNRFDSKNFKVDTRFNSSSDKNSKSNLLKQIEIDYTFNYNTSEGTLNRNTEFSAQDSTFNRIFKRSYVQDNKRISHFLNIEKKNVFGLGFSRYFGVHLRSLLNGEQYNDDNNVSDFNINDNTFYQNNYLTNISKYSILNETFGLALSKSYFQKISSRYSKSIDLQLFPGWQYYQQSNSSLKAFQNLQRNFLNFTPSATLSYTYEKANLFKRSLTLNVKKAFEYPQVNQIAPLIDEANTYYQNYGNPNLKPASDNAINLSLNHNSLNLVPLVIGINFRMGIIQNAFADSNNYDALGRNNHYTINVSRRDYFGLNSKLYKTYKFNKHSFQFDYMGIANYSESPAYLNSIRVQSINFVTSNELGINYEYRSVTFRINEKLETYKVIQKGEDVTSLFSSKIYITTFSGKLAWPKNIILGTNVNYSLNKSSNTERLSFIIWNSSVSYRFLKQKNAEIGLSALDILKQNKGIVNYISYNNLIKGQTNILQQYFMVSLSFFPRKFGF